MVRADRLVAILLLLQTHGQLTAARLAQLLETSERTVRRDLEALCMAGVPLYAQRGRGGGWALLGRNRLDLTGFTAGEAQALFLVAGGAGGQPAGVEPELRSALRKVLTALPEPLRAQAAAAGQATVVDPAAWGRPATEEPPLLGSLRRAVLDRVQIDLDYAKPASGAVRRRVHPYGLVAKGGVWYLLAGTAAGRRTFRVSRVAGVALTEEPADLPEGLDLADEWASAVHDFQDRMQGVTVEVAVVEAAVLRLTTALGGWAAVEAGTDDAAAPGWRHLSFAVPHPRAAVAVLAPFGGDVRVLSPDAVRADLARLGRDLAAVHGDPAPPAG